MTKSEAQIMRDYYFNLLQKLMAAKLALLDGGVKSYTIDNRSLTRFDLDVLTKDIEDAKQKLAEYDAILAGKKPRKAVAIIPRDF